MNIEKIISFDMDQNCYLVYRDIKKAVLIDPGFDTEKILKVIGDKGVTVTDIILTHEHYDHVHSVNTLRDGKNLICSKDCSKNIGSSSYNLSLYSGTGFEIEPADRIVSDGEVFTAGGIEFTAIETPGHSSGSMCFLAEDNLFSGDTLFLRSVGRWDLPTGNENELRNSIKNKLYKLPDDTKIFAGHGNDSIIRYEKSFNMFVTSDN